MSSKIVTVEMGGTGAMNALSIYLKKNLFYPFEDIYSHQFQANIFSVCLGFLIATSEIDTKYCGELKEGGLISYMGELVWMSASGMGMWLVRMGMWPAWMDM